MPICHLLDFSFGNLFGLDQVFDLRLLKVQLSLGGVQVRHQLTVFSPKLVLLLLQISLRNSTLVETVFQFLIFFLARLQL